MSTPLDIIKDKRQKAVENINARSEQAVRRVYVGMATCEIAAGSRDVMAVFKEAIQSGKLKSVYLSQKGCAGRCNLEPTVEVYEEGRTPCKYGQVTAQKAKEIMERHLVNGEVIEEWLI